MNTEYERTKKWLKGFFNYVRQEAIELLPLFGQRIYFFPEEDEENSIKVGLDDLEEIYASKDEIKKMRQLFEFYAKGHKV